MRGLPEIVWAVFVGYDHSSYFGVGFDRVNTESRTREVFLHI